MFLTVLGLQPKTVYDEIKETIREWFLRLVFFKCVVLKILSNC